MIKQVHHRNFRPLLATGLAMALLCACTQNDGKAVATRSQVAPRNNAAKYDGIDISSHQGFIDWAKVSSDKDIRFVYIKATEGSTYHSPHYVHNMTQAKRHGLLVGSYHYLTASSPIDEQFDNFSQLALKDLQDLIPMLDVEVRGDWSRTQLIDSVEKFCALTERHYGVQPMIYSTMGFYNKNLAPRFNKYHLYIGRYSNSEPEINWEGEYTIWQYSETGIIPGIDAYVDLCRYRKDGWLDEIMLPHEENTAEQNADSE
ncbi:MAG: glycosyl hydrolase family 25 [Muribaculaceae bacterium]|nr:glycosyl hydrolase family 25 [Muribaculaceae bacterium]